MEKKDLKTIMTSLMITALFFTFITPIKAEPLVFNTSPLLFTASNLEHSLVNIKAVDRPTVYKIKNKVGLGEEQRWGQGIILEENGIIATNRHIIGHATHIYVSIEGGQILEATILRQSQEDLCFIKINPSTPLHAISLANASELHIGKPVVAIANGVLNSQRVLGGKIINIFRNPSKTVEFLETNIQLKPGDSGGPILNEEGSLVGLIIGKQISDPSKSYAIAATRIQQEYFKYRNSVLDS